MSTLPHPPLDIHHPVVSRELAKRADDVQLRIADLITKFAGSMMFVYIHVAVFAGWMVASSRWSRSSVKAYWRTRTSPSDM